MDRYLELAFRFRVRPNVGFMIFKTLRNCGSESNSRPNDCICEEWTAMLMFSSVSVLLTLRLIKAQTPLRRISRDVRDKSVTNP